MVKTKLILYFAFLTTALACPSSGTGLIWGNQVTAVDDPASGLGGNFSDITYDPAGILWGVKNAPSIIYKLGVQPNGKWKTIQSWPLTYPLSTDSPDSEGITKGEWSDPALYIAVERSNNNAGVQCDSIIRFDTGTGQSTHNWNITHNAANPETLDIDVDSNLGLEGITWIPDTFLVAKGFRDERLNKNYAPGDYPLHGSGLFAVALEQNGKIYLYALQNDLGFKRISTIVSGLPQLMGLEFDRETGYLWAKCDNSCANKHSVLKLEGGKFVSKLILDPPPTLPNSNIEDIALFPESACVNGKKPVLWADDSGANGTSIYQDTVQCGQFIP